MPLLVRTPDRPAPWQRAGLALALLGLVLFPSTALAHQNLRATSPAAGDTLLEVPGEIRFTFTEPVRLDFTDVVVQGPDGALVVGELRRATDNPRILVAPVASGWHAGEFTVRWTTVGADGHRTNGTVSFFVRDDADGLPVPEPDPVPADEPATGEVEASPPHHDPGMFPETPTFGPQSPAYVAIRALLYLALVAMLGALALRWVVLPVTAQQRPEEAEAVRGAVDRGAARVGFIAATVLLVAALARLWGQSASLFGVAGALEPSRLAQVLTLQPWALGWWLQATAAVVGMVGFLLAARAVRGGWALAVAAALAAAVTPALSGHASAMGPLSWVAVPTDTLHVIAAGGWIGSLLALVAIGIPAALGLDPQRRATVATALVQGFSPTALVFTGILVTTGVVSAWLHLGEFAALWTSTYGQTLLLKVGIFAAVALVGAYNFLRVRPALGETKGAARLRRSGAVELLLATAVIVVTAVLVALPPP